MKGSSLRVVYYKYYGLFDDQKDTEGQRSIVEVKLCGFSTHTTN